MGGRQPSWRGPVGAVAVVLAAALGPATAATAGVPAPAPRAPQRMDLLVALVRWTGNPADASTLADAQTVATAATDWIEAASRGAVDVVATARDWTTIPAPSGSCNSSSISAQALAGLTSAGVNVASYEQIVVYFGPPAGTACAFYGLSGRPMLLAGKSGDTADSFRYAAVHELGHNLGLPHANTLSCTGPGGVRVTLSGSCTSAEQSDPFDMMGYAGLAGLFNAAFLDRLGWLPAAEVLRVPRTPGAGSTRTVTLTPLAAPAAGGTRAVRVDGLDGQAWWIEVRHPVGLDAGGTRPIGVLGSGAGVQVRREEVTWTGPGRTHLLDMHPTTASDPFGPTYHDDAALGPGGTWTAPDGSITVSEGATAGGDGSREVTVTLREVPAAPAKPTVVVGDRQATVTWAAPGTGGSAITGYVVTPYVGATAQTPRLFDASATSRVITGLTGGTAYTFKVAAKNAVGTGAASPASAAATPWGPYRPFASWDAFVARQLLDFTGSAGTSSTRAPSVAQLAAGSPTPAAFIRQRMEGTWFAGYTAPVARLYWAYFGRIPDHGGVTYWAAKRRAGTSLNTVSQSFASSAEFKARYGSLTNGAFVELVYQNVLGRPGEPGGVAYWTQQLDQAERSRGQVMVGFSESAEYKAKKGPEVTTLLVYAGMLRRAPSVAELAAGAATDPTALIEQVRVGAEYDGLVP